MIDLSHLLNIRMGILDARMHKGTEQMLGMFANTLVYRGQPSLDKMWTQFLQEVKEMSLE
nr:hypothetical protein [Staphylococcus aureus]